MLIAEGGLEALSMRQLSTVAALAVNTLYALFGSREGVIEAVIADAIDHTAIELGDIEGDDPIELAVRFASTGVRSRCAAAAYTRPLFRALSTSGDHQAASMRYAAPLLTRIMQRGVDGGWLRADVDLDLVVRHILNTLVHASTRWAFHEIDDDTYLGRGRLCRGVEPGGRQHERGARPSRCNLAKDRAASAICDRRVKDHDGATVFDTVFDTAPSVKTNGTAVERLPRQDRFSSRR